MYCIASRRKLKRRVSMTATSKHDKDIAEVRYRAVIKARKVKK
jgi:hypothetical protein